MKRVCINCGSSSGRDPLYTSEAANAGRYLAENKIGIVYGGSDVGLMGAVADSALAVKGEVIGVIPELMEKKVAHKGLTRLFVVKTMHERKKMMFDLSDGFIALPGGIGTLEEIFEILTWGQLGYSHKPCAFLNIGNYYDKLFDFLDYAMEKSFVRKEHRDMIIKEDKIENIIDKFISYKAPDIEKWIR